MELTDKNIGFAITGSRRTMILIQINYLQGLRTGWVQKCILWVQGGCKKPCFVIKWVHNFILRIKNRTYQIIFDKSDFLYECVL